VPSGRRAVLCTFLELVAVVGFGVTIQAPAFGQTPEPGAYADIVSPVQEKLGTAKFSPVEDGVKIELDVIQQVPGLHAVHILSAGKCQGPYFMSAGPHFDPYGKQHGSLNPNGPHAGDLPNVEAGLDGHLEATIIAKGVTLGEGPNSLFHPGGTAIVIDENADDYKTNPDGNSGPHVACGVIRTDGAATAP
jgi:superoxide dismutase, Cu-Zn family